jgi:dehydrodolichyl diphosphate syntase complex subunit NUS1
MFKMSIFDVILAVVHWLLGLTFVISCSCRRLSSFVRRLKTVLRSSDTGSALCKPLTNIDKLPVHISLVVVEDDISLVDIARLVAWSTAAGIGYVTIYDHRGHCKQNRADLLNKVINEWRQVTVEKRGKVHCDLKSSNSPLSFHIQDERLLAQNGWHMADSATSEPRVFILGPDDGRQGLVDVARQLSCAAASQRLVPADISVSYVDTLIQDKFGFPDPDLVLKFGQVDSVLGFLPWQLRLSEIISVATHRGISLVQFIDALVAFGNTEQRYGK